jgi:hypothetical protein
MKGYCLWPRLFEIMEKSDFASASPPTDGSHLLAYEAVPLLESHPGYQAPL